MFTIKNFGNDTACANGQELRTILKEKYAGNSVSIHYRKKGTGMKIGKFVDVQEDGSLKNSYTGDAIRISEFEAEAA